MKIVYISNTRMPHNRAHSIQVAKMAEAFNKQANTTLIVPLKMNSSRSLTYDSYKISKKFNIMYVPSVDFVFLNLGILFFYIQSLTFSLTASLYSLFLKKDIYYTRDIFTAAFLSFLKSIHKRKVFYEIHGEPAKFEKVFVKATLKRVNGIVVLNKYLADYYSEYNNNVLMAPDGVDLSMFYPADDKKPIREILNIELNKMIVLYSGHLYKWKGVYTLFDAAKLLPEGFIIYILGGTDDDIKAVKDYIKSNSIKNVTVLGRVEYKDVPNYMLASDILVLPNSRENKMSMLYTSPLKLFEYMASGNVIVSTDIPSSRVILNDKNSILVPPDDPGKLAKAIRKAADKSSGKLVKQSLIDVRQYSWDNRASNIISFFNQ